MHYLPRWTIVALILFLTGSAEAGPPWFVTVGKITRIGTGLVGEGLYLTMDVPTHDNNCNTNDMLFMERANIQYQETLSIALLTLAQGRPVDVFYDGTCNGGA
jgi:hypothetical protein